jgi:hypothetical protein
MSRVLAAVLGETSCPRQRLCSIRSTLRSKSTCYHFRPSTSPSLVPVRATQAKNARLSSGAALSRRTNIPGPRHREWFGYLRKVLCEVGLYTFRRRKQKISRIQCVSFQGQLQCSTMPCISPSALRLGGAIRNSSQRIPVLASLR